jgi:hypothetical protein
MLSFVILGVVMLRDVILSVFMHSDVMLGFVILYHYAGCRYAECYLVEAEVA